MQQCLLQVAYLIVDDMHMDHPELIRDYYWDTAVFDIPYTAASSKFKEKNPILGSAMNLKFVIIIASHRPERFCLSKILFHYSYTTII